jgi:hypothetical protein
MTDAPPAPALFTIGAVLAAGVIGAAVSLAGRNADTQFLQNQRHPPALQAAAVERVVRTAPDPKSGKGSGSSATCTRHGSGTLGNPWSCLVRFPSGKRVRLKVVVNHDGSYDGTYIGVRGAAASGCCVELAGSR